MKKILAPSNRARWRMLNEFRDDLSGFARARLDRNSQEEARFRTNLNRRLLQVREIVLRAGVPTRISVASALVRASLDVFVDLFHFDEYHINRQVALDAVDQAIGRYDSDHRAAFWRAFNPFYYIGLLFYWVGSIPFWILSRLGFDGSKVEGSRIGRVIKFLAETVTFFGVIVALLQAFKVWPFQK